MVERLRRDYPVVLWQQGHLGEVGIAAGATGYECGIGWREACNINTSKNNRRRQQHSGARQARPVYISALGRSLPKRSLQAISRHRDLWLRLICPDPDCYLPSGRGLLGDARAHAVVQRARQLERIAHIDTPVWRWQPEHHPAPPRCVGCSGPSSGLRPRRPWPRHRTTPAWCWRRRLPVQPPPCQPPPDERCPARSSGVDVLSLPRTAPSATQFNRRQGLEQPGEVLGDGLPQDVEVDIEVVVNGPVTRACGGSPRHAGFGGLQFEADVLGKPTFGEHHPFWRRHQLLTLPRKYVVTA
jgi:hypothetical protein